MAGAEGKDDRANVAVPSSKVDAALEGIDDAKRKTVRGLVIGAVFVTPVVASFPIDGLTVSRAMALGPNSTTS